MSVDQNTGAAVSAEMERIFERARRPRAPVPPLPVVTTPKPGRRAARPGKSGRMARMAAPAFVLLAVSAVGAVILTPRDIAAPRAASTATRPATAPAAASSPPLMVQTPAPVAVADPVDTIGMAAVDVAEIVPPADDATAPAPAGNVPARRSDAWHPSVRGDVYRPPNRRTAAATAAPAARPAVDCGNGRNRAACLYREVRQADERLRAAYRRAEDAGVARNEMVEVRRMWNRALDGSVDNPQATIRRYDQLAAQLDKALGGPQSAER